MRINSKTISERTSFGSIPLYRATLMNKKLFKAPVPVEAFVSIVEKSDAKRGDFKPKNWFFSHYGLDILSQMEENLFSFRNSFYGFLAVEIPSFKEPKQVKAIASYFFGKENLVLPWLQSKSETAFFSQIKGAGSLIIYALSKIAQRNYANGIFLNSSSWARKFYKKLGFDEIAIKEFQMPKQKFQKMQKTLEEKFQIKEALKS